MPQNSLLRFRILIINAITFQIQRHTSFISISSCFSVLHNEDSCFCKTNTVEEHEIKLKTLAFLLFYCIFTIIFVEKYNLIIALH